MDARNATAVGPDGEEYRCFRWRVTCSSWITREGTVRHRFHDTGEWGDVLLPRCRDSTGAMYTSGSLRVDVAVARAWEPSYCGQLADTALAPSITRAVEAARTSGTIDDVASACRVSNVTAWGYLCKACCSSSTSVDTENVLRLLHPTLRSAVVAETYSGKSLRAAGELFVRAHGHLGLSDTELYAQLRIARVVGKILYVFQEKN